MKLLFNGVLVPEDQYSFTSGVVDVTDNDDSGETIKGVSDEFELKGAAYELVLSQFIESPEYMTNSIEVKIFEDGCCDNDVLLFEGEIRANSVSYCHGDCFCSVKFTEKTTTSQAYDCFRSTLIADNWNNFVAQQHPRIMYCIEHRPEAVGYLLIALCAIVNLVLGIFQIVVAIISWIIDRINNLIQFLNNMIGILNAIPGVSINTIGYIDLDGNPETSLLDQYQGWLNNFNDRLIGCNRKHPSPLVRSYIQNVCAKCGVAFQSSILNSPGSEYWDMVLFSAKMAKGTNSDSVTWIGANEPYETGNTFLNKLAIPFSAEWRIENINGQETLIFERADYFDQGAIQVDFNSLETQGRVDGKLCLNFTDEEQPAYLRITYSADPLDICGNEAQILYSDIVEWNQPFNAAQVGEKTVQIPFGMARFRDDGINEDILGTAVGIGGFGDNIESHNGALILNAHTAGEYKLLIWDGNVINGRVRRYFRSGFGSAFGLQDSGYSGSGDDVYNFPLLPLEWQCAPNTGYPANVPNGSLYKRFHAWKNPKLHLNLNRQWSFTFKYDCSTISNLSNLRFANLPMGVGRIRKISVDSTNKTITLSGLI